MFQCRDIDALMMDWLYGELDPDQAQHVSTHVEDCNRCHSELAAYQRTRELVSELPSEEPSSAISALLIREAATRGPAVKAAEAPRQGGFFAWLGKLFQPLQHPALAAVATLVLVAGVAGTLYLRDGEDHFAEPETAATATAGDKEARLDEREADDVAAAAQPAQPAATEAAPETVAAKNDEPADGFAEGAFDGRAKDAAKSADSNRRTDLLESKPKPAPRRDLLSKERKQEKKAAPAKAPRGPSPKSGTLKKGYYKTNAVTGGDPLLFDSDGTSSGKFEGDGAGSTASQPYRAYRDRPDAWVESQTLRITEAYNRKDCLTTAKIANDILDRSPELYTKRTKNLEAVKRCKVYVQRERSKRAVARKKAGTTSSSKAAGQKAKAKRAPQPAPAADLEQAVE